MVCVAEDYLSFDVVVQFALVNTFYRTYRADRHEYRSEDIAVTGVNNAGPCGRVAVGMLEIKEHDSLCRGKLTWDDKLLLLQVS